MAVLRGFPSSDTISPTIYINDEDLSSRYNRSDWDLYLYGKQKQKIEEKVNWIRDGF